MGQVDIINILQNEPHRWFTLKEIKEKLRSQGRSNGTIKGACNDIYKLALFKMIDCKGVGLWKHEKLFKLKESNTD